MQFEIQVYHDDTWSVTDHCMHSGELQLAKTCLPMKAVAAAVAVAVVAVEGQL